MPDGICPFADQIVGRSSLIGYQPGYIDRVGFCDHTAGGWFSTLTRVSFWNDPNGNGQTEDAVSVHFAVGRKGEKLQILNIFDTAFAQGRLGPTVSWPYYDNPAKPYRRTNPNYLLISTEHEDIESANGHGVYVPGSEWTEEQYKADLSIKRWCVDEVRRVKGIDLLQYDIESLTGHHMFDNVNRAECPGRFWRDEYRARLFADLSKPKESDVLHRWKGSANPDYWHNRQPDTEQGANARGDWSLPAEAKSIEVEVFLTAGAVDVMDGGTADGKAFFVRGSGFQHGRVYLDSNGFYWMKNIGGAVTRIDQILCLGYYTD